MHKEIIRKLPISKKIFLFYRTTTLFGLFFTLFGLFFCSIFLQGLDIKEIIKLNEELGEIQGTITNIFETKMTVNDSRIFEYQYEYNIKGESYLWQSFNGANSLEIGNSVTIEYNLNSPEYSVIKGYSSLKGGLWSLFVLIFPFIGILFLSFSVFRGASFLKIINNGVLTYGKFSHKEATLTKVNGKTVYKLYFEFEARNKTRHTIKVKTHKTDRLTDEKEELMIYKKDTPNKTLLVDDLPKSVSSYIKKNWIK